jgi:predicted DNA-binding protein YlxM (UPF0122 family)
MARKKVQQLDKSECPANIDLKVDKVNLLEALQLRYINKLTYQQIADKYGVTKQAIEQRLSAFKDKFGDSQEIQLYDTNRGSLLTLAEKDLLTNMLDPSKLSKATINNLAYAFQQVFNARRLEEGKSTANLHGIYGLVLQLDRDERKAVKPTEDEVIDVSE